MTYAFIFVILVYELNLNIETNNKNFVLKIPSDNIAKKVLGNKKKSVVLFGGIIKYIYGRGGEPHLKEIVADFHGERKQR